MSLPALKFCNPLTFMETYSWSNMNKTFLQGVQIEKNKTSTSGTNVVLWRIALGQHSVVVLVPF